MSSGNTDAPPSAVLVAALPDCLLDPGAYPHPVGQIRLVETHMSWLFLTGEIVYKVKKPVHFDFVDFSLRERRRHYCLEELRLNAGFAPELYLAVVPIVAAGQGKARLAPELCLPSDNGENPTGVNADVIDWAVQMRQFDTAQEADVLVAEGRASDVQFYEFGTLLASQHRALPAVFDAASIESAIMGNFTTLARLGCTVPWRGRLETLAQQLVAKLGALRLRSDVLRKQREGLTPDARTESGVGSGLYGADQTDALYADLAGRAVALLRSGEDVIVFLTHQ